MAYTVARRDHVWFIQSDGTAGGVTVFGDTARLRTLRWHPVAVTDTVTLDGVKPDGPTQSGWEACAGGPGDPLLAQESRLDVRLTFGFKVVMPSGGKLYLYEALDGPAGGR